MFVWMEQNSLVHISLFLVLFKRSREPNIKSLFSHSPLSLLTPSSFFSTFKLPVTSAFHLFVISPSLKRADSDLVLATEQLAHLGWSYRLL